MMTITRTSMKTNWRWNDRFKTEKSLVTPTAMLTRSGLCRIFIASVAGSTAAVADENAGCPSKKRSFIKANVVSTRRSTYLTWSNNFAYPSLWASSCLTETNARWSSSWMCTRWSLNFLREGLERNQWLKIHEHWVQTCVRWVQHHLHTWFKRKMCILWMDWRVTHLLQTISMPYYTRNS